MKKSFNSKSKNIKFHKLALYLLIGISLLSFNSVFAAGRLTFVVNNGTFDDGTTQNIVSYSDPIKSSITKYSHTDNISDDGTQNGNYGNNEIKTEVITIEGASSLTVTVIYGGESSSYDWVSIFSGSHPTYAAASKYSSADIVQKLGGGSHTSQTKTYTISGDSVTFAWKSDGSNCGDGYGYYAVVTGTGVTYDQTGEYKQPTPTDSNQRFRGWTTTQGSTTVEYKADGSNLPKTQTKTLYAAFTDFSWTEDWNYELVDNYVWLHEYIGSETTYTVPASATVDGKTYTTKIGYWDNVDDALGNPLAQLETGTITNLSFEDGLVLGSDLTDLFYNCSSLTSLDVSNFNTSNVTNMYEMFRECKNLISLDLSSFDTSNVTDMTGMFSGCSNLTSLDVSNFNTSEATYISSMFSFCSKLTSLDLSSFDTSNVTSMYGMFSGCSNLITIYASSSFVTTNITSSSNMFFNCSNLVGGNGTTYNSSYTDKTYARIDTASTPGYFTEKYRISFVLDIPEGSGISVPESISVGKGESTTLPTIESYGLYLFSGWYTAEVGGTSVSSPYTPTSSVTLYGLWDKISGTTYVANCLVDEDGTVVLDTDKIVEGQNYTLVEKTFTIPSANPTEQTLCVGQFISKKTESVITPTYTLNVESYNEEYSNSFGNIGIYNPCTTSGSHTHSTTTASVPSGVTVTSVYVDYYYNASGTAYLQASSDNKNWRTVASGDYNSVAGKNGTGHWAGAISLQTTDRYVRINHPNGGAWTVASNVVVKGYYTEPTVTGYYISNASVSFSNKEIKSINITSTVKDFDTSGIDTSIWTITTETVNSGVYKLILTPKVQDKVNNVTSAQVNAAINAIKWTGTVRPELTIKVNALG